MQIVAQRRIYTVHALKLARSVHHDQSFGAFDALVFRFSVARFAVVVAFHTRIGVRISVPALGAVFDALARVVESVQSTFHTLVPAWAGTPGTSVVTQLAISTTVDIIS